MVKYVHSTDDRTGYPYPKSYPNIYPKKEIYMALNKASQNKGTVNAAEEEVSKASAEAAAKENVDVLEPEVVESSSSTAAPAEPANQQVAVRPSTSLSVGKEVAEALEAQGFAPLTFDYHSFPNIKLQAEFEGPEGLVLPSDGFYVTVTGSRNKWALTSRHPVKEEQEVVFIYDKAEAYTEGSKAFEAIQKWKEQGVGYESKDYLDVMVTMLDDGTKDKTLEGMFCVLSLPRTSIGKFNVYISTLTAKYRRPIAEIVTKVSRGKKIMDAVQPFYPWKFDFHGMLEDWTPPGEE